MTRHCTACGEAFDDGGEDRPLCYGCADPIPAPMGARFHRLTPGELWKALIYRDHRGNGWWAYAPMVDDSLDADGTISASWFSTRSEAINFLTKALLFAVERPNETTDGMANVLDAI